MLDNVISQLEKSLPTKTLDIFGKNSLMFSAIPYYLLPTILLIYTTGVITNPFLILCIVYTFIPLLDEFFSLDQKNPNQQERQQLVKNDVFFQVALYTTVLADWYLFFDSMNKFYQHQWTISNTFQLLGAVFLFSNLNAIQFLIVHEICHRPGKINRWIATAHSSKLLYMHWVYQHLYGHHRRVATPQDAASAIQGESVYTFFPKSFFGSYKSVYKMEKEFGKPFYLNYTVLSVIAAILFSTVVFYFYNFQTLGIFLITQLGAIFYLQAINYIEHYGLRRQKKPNGQYEKVTIRHSWNAPHRFSNYLLYKLQRHSDHHENSTKPYQTLLSLQASPHLPHGYSLIIFMSFFPKVWFKVMDPIVQEYKRVKVGKIESQVMKKAQRDTRKFIIELGIGILLLFVASTFI